MFLEGVKNDYRIYRGIERGGGGGRLSSEFVRIAKHAALKHAGKKFGDGMVAQGEGSWLNDGELVVEECLNIRIIMPDPNDDRIHEFANAQPT